MTRVIVPVGLSMGQDFADKDAGERPEGSWQVHLGAEAAYLTPEELRAWATAFSDVQRHADHTFTRDHLERLLRQGGDGTADPAPVVKGLLDRRLLLEYDPADADWESLFGRLRLLPLVQGMGNTPERPTQYELGIAGEPILSVTANVYGLWSYSFTSATLWDACAELAQGVDEDLDPGEEPLGYTAAGVGAEIGAALPLLVATGCAFLDPV
jgi:hypothetical protein